MIHLKEFRFTSYAMLLSCCLLLLGACSKISHNRDKEIFSGSSDSKLKNSLYAKTDSMFLIDDIKYRVVAELYDLTDAMRISGDTLDRPTFACVVKIVNDKSKVIFSDSVLRDSWGYEGKIKAIDAYELTLPIFRYEANEIVMEFKLSERYDGDVVDGVIAFGLQSNTPRYYWKESEGF